MKKIQKNTMKLGRLVSREETILLKAARTAGLNAGRSSRALGLTVKIIKDDKIVEVHPDKSENILRSIDKSSVDISKLEKGQILRKKCLHKD